MVPTIYKAIPVGESDVKYLSPIHLSVGNSNTPIILSMLDVSKLSFSVSLTPKILSIFKNDLFAEIMIVVMKRIWLPIEIEWRRCLANSDHFGSFCKVRDADQPDVLQ